MVGQGAAHAWGHPLLTSSGSSLGCWACGWTALLVATDRNLLSTHPAGCLLVQELEALGCGDEQHLAHGGVLAAANAILQDLQRSGVLEALLLGGRLQVPGPRQAPAAARAAAGGDAAVASRAPGAAGGALAEGAAAARLGWLGGLRAWMGGQLLGSSQVHHTAGLDPFDVAPSLPAGHHMAGLDPLDLFPALREQAEEEVREEEMEKPHGQALCVPPGGAAAASDEESAGGGAGPAAAPAAAAPAGRGAGALGAAGQAKGGGAANSSGAGGAGPSAAARASFAAVVAELRQRQASGGSVLQVERRGAALGAGPSGRGQQGQAQAQAGQGPQLSCQGWRLVVTGHGLGAGECSRSWCSRITSGRLLSMRPYLLGAPGWVWLELDGGWAGRCCGA
jgi:hypothetical protein